jgi:hypothetical protein
VLQAGVLLEAEVEDLVNEDAVDLREWRLLTYDRARDDLESFHVRHVEA